MVRISEEVLINLLLADGRMPAVKLAEKLNVTETAVRKKMRKLEERGVIKQYSTLVDPKKAGYEVTAFLGVDTRSKAFLPVIKMLRLKDEVRQLCSASGDHMLMMECWFRTQADMERFVTVLEKTPGVTIVCPAMLTEKLK